MGEHTNYIEIWHGILTEFGWYETGWNSFESPNHPRVQVFLHPKRMSDRGPVSLSQKWEIRVDGKVVGSGMAPQRLRDLLSYTLQKYETKEAPKNEGNVVNIGDWLAKRNMTASFISIPLGMCQPPYTKVAISVPELVAQTNAFSVQRRPNCNATRIESNPKELFLHYNVKCHENYSDPAGHDVRVKFDVSKVMETKNAKDLDVQVNCSCPAFLYWGAQWNLHQRDGLLGEPRPQLKAPTKNMNLRGNFVICKHVKAVMERILPSVQNNMITIMREQEVKKNEEQQKDKPLTEREERTRQRQEEMKKRQLKKLRDTKNKEVQQKLLDALRKREDERRNNEVEHEEDKTKVQDGENPAVVKREGPATEPIKPTVVETPKTEDIRAEEPPETHDVNELVEQEEQKLQQREHENVKGKPHLHEGLPYETDTEKQEHGHAVPSDKELVKVLKDKKQQQTNNMKNFVEQKLKRKKRTSLQNPLLASPEAEHESSN